MSRRQDRNIENLMATQDTTSFHCTRLNPTTFLIIEDDSYSEQPFIYIKLYPNLIIVSNTGCNRPRDKTQTVTNLRHYLETYPIPSNAGRPLNPSGQKPYLILCSHAHYDHILGIPSFLPTQPSIVASSHCKSFIETDFPKHSLCKYLHIPTPKYTITHWGSHLEYLLHPGDGSPLRIQLLHIPGHTPDSLAWYDIEEHHLYVGDTFYERRRKRDPDDNDGLPEIEQAIEFPLEGNLIDYMSSLELIISFVSFQNATLKRQWEEEGEVGEKPRVLVGCGHMTVAADAEEMTREVQELFWKIIEGRLGRGRSVVKRGVEYGYWVEGEGARYAVEAPRRLVEEARRHFGGRWEGKG